MFYYVYVLKSVKDGSIYVGANHDLRARFLLHNKGRVHSTRSKMPWKIVYYEAFISKEDAFSREASLKLHAQGLRRLKERLQNSL
ncbi:MAG: GIY-YIG nuclease family protein [Patescibacteria group bacterium]